MADCQFSSDSIVTESGDLQLSEINEYKRLLLRGGAIDTCSLQTEEFTYLVATWNVISGVGTYKSVIRYSNPPKTQKFVWDRSATGHILCYLEDSANPGRGRPFTIAVDSSYCK